MTYDAIFQRRQNHHRDFSPAGQALFFWLRNFARAVKLARLYRAENPLVIQVREQVSTALETILNEHGTQTLKFSAQDIRLDREIIVLVRP